MRPPSSINVEISSDRIVKLKNQKDLINFYYRNWINNDGK